MWYVVMTLLGMACGGVCVFMTLESKRKRLEEQARLQEEQVQRTREALQEISKSRADLDKQSARLTAAQAEFKAKTISYQELQNENAILKRDLKNSEVQMRKLQLDREAQKQSQAALDQRGQELGSRYLKDNVRWISTSLTPNNFANCSQRLKKVVEACREIGLDVSAREESALLSDLKTEYERAVRAALEREEQARLKAQIREEQQLEKEREREINQAERERAAVQAALDKALAETKDQHSAELERLRARLAEAEAKAQRAISRAQMTKSGHVYVISNIGSFGENIFKIGMTRRLEPQDRIKELGDASVPFPFDVHMMISSNDAPTLENALHRALHKYRINKTNPRKEFFKISVETICQIVEKHHGKVDYIADAEALEYRQSLSMSEDEQEYIENVYTGINEKQADSEGEE